MNVDQIKEAIRTLEQLRSEGLISDEECSREKSQLLAQLRQTALGSGTSGGTGSSPSTTSAPQQPAPMRGADLFMTGGAGIDRDAAMQATPATQVLPRSEPSLQIATPMGGDAWMTGGQQQTPTPTVPSALSVGQVLRGRYRVLRLLGRGGMGEVYLVFDEVRERELALKRIHPQLAHDPSIKARFLHELNVNEKLTHAGIVRTYAVDEDPESQTIFFTMEYVEGESLEQRLQTARNAGKEPPLDFEESIQILESLAAILDFAHKKGIVHRDLKPGNVMLTPQKEVKLMDFGLAKLLQDNQPQHHTGFVGTVYYMAPEQMRGGQVSHTADIYSLGILMYQLLTGQIYQGGMPGPSGILKQLPPAVDAVFLRSIHWKPEERYPTATEMIAELRGALAQGGLVQPPNTSPSTFSSQSPLPISAVSSQVPRFASERLEPTLTLEAHEDWLSSCSFSPDGSLLATASWDHSISVWSMPTGDLKQTWIGHEDAVEACVFLSAKELISVDRGGLVLRWSVDAPTPQAQGTLESGGGVCWSFLGQEILSFGWDGQIQQFNPSTFQAQSQGPVSSRALLAGDFSANSGRYVASSEDGVVFWGQRLSPPERSLRLSVPVLTLRWLPDGKSFLAGGDDGILSIWSTDAQQPSVEMRGHEGPIYACDNSRGGSLLLSGGDDGTMRLWDAGGRSLAVGRSHTAPISDARFSPDGRWVASVSQDRTICLWSLPS
ncbi:MAG: serine/threonine protein kinase [Myxococcales bacterium]|nr:serine/threonine protein kinase [Myxococcales bacterium]